MGGLWYLRIENNTDKCRPLHLGLKNELPKYKRGDLDWQRIFKDIFILNYEVQPEPTGFWVWILET